MLKFNIRRRRLNANIQILKSMINKWKGISALWKSQLLESQDTQELYYMNY
ncbi:hypothetical protein WR164_14050 [Philodulcilactobacillus myokoensis]|uniref:Uncharacterized protein n=1 Tax=Philodulcilactobacillus myokoensis TaxID=2929573 RepID=A0A9W6B261_9LACO|nr:hypothetical protein WR164_14050 [Philodulcilactobacillus myokoensis]